jgi:hypothetical protein
VTRRLAVAFVLAAVGFAVVLALVPFTSGTACTLSDTAPAVCTTDHRSLLDSEGSSVLLVLALPVLLAAAAVAARTRRARMVLAGLLTALAVLGAASIGLFLLPVVALAWLYACSTSASSAAK